MFARHQTINYQEEYSTADFEEAGFTMTANKMVGRVCHR
jgi:hypothetical protein